MFNFFKSKIKLSASGITSIILSVLLVISIILGCGIYFGDWFKSSGINGISSIDVEEDYDLAENMVFNTDNSGKIKLTAARTVAASSNSTTPVYVEDSYTITAEYNDGATNPTFSWQASNSTYTSNGTIVVYISTTISDDTTQLTVKCNTAFDKQIVITCTADDDETITATCTIDYIYRATDASFSLAYTYGTDLSWSGGGGSAEWLIPGDDWNDDYDSSDNVFVNNSISTGSYSVTYSGSGTLAETYSVWTVGIFYVNDSLDDDPTAYLLSNDISHSDNDDSLNLLQLMSCYRFYTNSFYPNSSTSRNNYYNTLMDYYSAGTGVTFRVTFVGDITGIQYTFDYLLLANPSELYDGVTYLDLSDTAICF